VKYEPSHVVEDFIFINIEIDNGALSLMMTLYIDLLPTWKEYLTDMAKNTSTALGTICVPSGGLQRRTFEATQIRCV